MYKYVSHEVKMKEGKVKPIIGGGIIIIHELFCCLWATELKVGLIWRVLIIKSTKTKLGIEGLLRYGDEGIMECNKTNDFFLTCSTQSYRDWVVHSSIYIINNTKLQFFNLKLEDFNTIIKN